MSWQLSPYVIALFFSALISAVFAAMTWPWRNSPGGRPIVWFTLAASEWTFAAALEAAAIPVPIKILLSQISYIGVVSTPVFFFLFALEYTGWGKRLSRKQVAGLWVIPLMILFLAATNQWHRLLWPRFSPSPHSPNILIYSHGPAYWVLIFYSYLLLLIGTLLIIRVALNFRNLYRGQSLLLLLALIVPWVANALYAFNLSPFPHLDLAPAAFGLTGALMSLNITRYRFFDLIPVARDALIERMQDGVLVVDGKNRIIDINPSARHLLAVDSAISSGKPGTMLNLFPELAPVIHSSRETHYEIKLPGTPPRFLEAHISPLHGRSDHSNGRLIVLRDISDRKQTEAEREQLVGELREALASVKTLHGLLPICANCKKVRDDEGYWEDVEEYVARHSEAAFSHGICPECLKQLYPKHRPEKYKEKESRKDKVPKE